MPRFFLRRCRTGLIRIKCRRVVAQDSFTFGIEVLELTPLHGPAKHGQDHEHKAG